MWEYQHSMETTASPDAVWRVWSDVAAWPRWNNGIEKIQIDGPFTVGTTFTMTPPGDQPIQLRLVEIVPRELFTDEMDAGGFVVRTEHRLEPTATGRTRIIYRTEITGPDADEVGPQLGPAITADFPRFSPRSSRSLKPRPAVGYDAAGGGVATKLARSASAHEQDPR